MKYALLNGKRVEPDKGLSGAICPLCKTPVFARCGEERMPHWAHKTVIKCDEWSEEETEWHRRWKDRFGELQEQVHRKGDVSHMADVKTPDGLIVIFRRKSLNEEGRATREAFFGTKMIWVVDCSQSSALLARFRANKTDGATLKHEGREFLLLDEPEKCFWKRWVHGRRRITLFDFGESESRVWCLLPSKGFGRKAACIPFSRDEFVDLVKRGYVDAKRLLGGCYRKAFDFIHGRISWFEAQGVAIPELNQTVWEEPIVEQTADMASGTLRRQESAAQERCVSMVETPFEEMWRHGPTTLRKVQENVWEEDFDKGIVAAITLNPVSGWLVAHGFLTEVESELRADFPRFGRCAIHFLPEIDPTGWWWGKKNLERVVAAEYLDMVPSFDELAKHGGEFVGVVDYRLGRPGVKGTCISLRNFRWLRHRFKYDCGSEVMWQLDESTRQQIESQTPQS